MLPLVLKLFFFLGGCRIANQLVMQRREGFFSEPEFAVVSTTGLSVRCVQASRMNYEGAVCCEIWFCARVLL